MFRNVVVVLHFVTATKFLTWCFAAESSDFTGKVECCFVLTHKRTVLLTVSKNSLLQPLILFIRSTKLLKSLMLILNASMLEEILKLSYILCWMKGVCSNDSFVTMLPVKYIFIKLFNGAMSPENLNFSHFGAHDSTA